MVKEERHIVGIVVFDGERFLLLHRKLNWQGWEYPKGGIENNETPRDTVGRELLEETGIKNFEIISELSNTEFIDEIRDAKVIVSNFLVHVSSNSKVILNNPQLKDGKKELIIEHDDFKWFFPKEAVNILTHDNTKLIMKEAIKVLGLDK